MRILLVLKQKKNVDTFLDTIRALVARGHAVSLTIQERSERESEYSDEIDSPHFSVVRGPAHRTDDWSQTAGLLRSLRDCVQYQRPALHGATKLQARMLHKLREELRIEGDREALAGALRRVPPAQIERLEAVLRLAEDQLPRDPLYDEFLRAQAPDVLLVSPLVHFGSAQADVVASARALGIPVGMLLYSWDNLSTKGALHQRPEVVFVWNERQRREARLLHAFPEEQVVVVGAPRFDAFFDLRSIVPREDFLAPLGLDASRPMLLYVCSSRFVAASELSFLRKWLAAIRGSAFAPLREANVIVRPHPDIALLGDDEPVEELRWPAMRGAKGLVSRPFDDPRAVVLRTSNRTPQAFYECIGHSAAVVGLNTSAELEAAIVGRPVYTVMAGDDEADGQSSTLHFHYLLEEHGGCVRSARDLAAHIAQLEAELQTPQPEAAIRRFAGEFLRPHGIDRAVSPLLADAIERQFTHAATAPRRAAAGSDAGPELDAAIHLEPATDRRAVATVVVPYAKDATISVRVAGDVDTDGGPGLDKTTAKWLRKHVEIADVVYDIGAGTGLYAVVAARHRGATVVAFEPAYAAFADLCENIRLNDCDGAVMPLPLAVADFDGPGEVKYSMATPGQGRYSFRPGAWRARRAAGADKHFRQPVCVIPLDEAMRRYELRAPNHIRLGESAFGEAVLAGATSVLGLESLKTIFFTLPAEATEALAARLAPFDWTIASQKTISRGRAHVLLARSAALKA